MEWGRGIVWKEETCPVQGGLPVSGTQAGDRDERVPGAGWDGCWARGPGEGVHL